MKRDGPKPPVFVMNRRRVAISLVAFLALLCVGAPIAFQIGMARGESEARRYDFYPREVAAKGHGTEHFWDCYRQVRLPALRQFDRMQDCRPPGEGGEVRHAWGDRQTYRGPSRVRNGPLSKAFTALIAGEEPRIAGIQPEVPAPPATLAMAFDPLADPASGPFANPGSGIPGNLIPPSFGGGFIPPGNPQDPTPPVIETPIPGALPLLVSGLIVLGAARRRKAKSRQG